MAAPRPARRGRAPALTAVVTVTIGVLLSGDAFVSTGRAAASRSARLQRLLARAGTTRADADYDRGLAMLEGGRATHEKILEGIDIITQAALDGSAQADCMLGNFHCAGDLGLPKNMTLATHWWERAAAQGHGDAHMNLGIMKLNGDGVPMNKFEAGKSFKAAAEAGNIEAMMNLARMLMNGDGVPQDRDLAAQWVTRAMTARGDDTKDIIQRMGGDTLSPAEKMKITEAIDKLRAQSEKSDIFRAPSNAPVDEWDDDRGQV